MKSRWAQVILIFLLITVQAAAMTMTTEKRKQLSKKPRIHKIVIQGNRSFPEKTIRSKLYSKEDGFWQSIMLRRTNRFTKVNLYKDKALLDYFYRSQGFIDAATDVDFAVSDTVNGAMVYVRIDEGIRYRIGNVSVRGDLGRDAYGITAVAGKLKLGEYLDFYQLDATKQEIKTIYANSGYPYASIDMLLQRNFADSTVGMDININRNNLVVFGDVIVDTTLRTRRRIFDNEIVFRRGDTYSRKKFYESQQRLIRTNLFSYVTLDPPDSMTQLDSLMPSLRVRALERPPRFVNLAVGAGQDKTRDFVGDFSASMGDRNIGGTARKVRLESATNYQAFTNWRIVHQRFEFSYTEPYLFNVRLPLLLSVRYEPRLPFIIQTYSIRTIAFGATVVREFSLYSKLSVSFDWEQVKLFIGNVAAPDSFRFRDEIGIRVDRRLVFQLDQDTRPLQNRFNPSSGAYTFYRFEYVGGFLGGDDSFLKLVYNWSKYNVFDINGVFASRLQFGIEREFGKSQFVPSKERFYLGGAYTIRGFSENDFGPHNALGNIDGGTAIGLLNLELRKPLFTLVVPFWGSLFIDGGFNVAKVGKLSWRSPAVTGGVGIQVITPFGPFRVDYAQRAPINDAHGGGMFHYSILYAF